MLDADEASAMVNKWWPHLQVLQCWMNKHMQKFVYSLKKELQNKNDKRIVGSNTLM